VPTCEVYAVDDDRRIRESWVYGDMLDIFRQIAPAAAVSA
jgi:predicted ester cyclase